MGVILGGFSGLSWFRSRRTGLVVCLTLALASNIWFFFSTERNVRSVVEGSQQFGFFIAGAFLALALNIILSSIIRARDFKDRPAVPGNAQGLEALREATFFEALTRGLRRK